MTCRSLHLFLIAFAVTVPTLGVNAQRPAAETGEQHDRRMAWWRQAKFGMFIHWGLYSVPAGVWKNQDIPWLGEWIMNRARIPVAEYEQLAERFNPVEFNAEQWVKIAKDAGMRYIVIGAKHHDGFAMYGSKVSRYNIVDATPFHRDPMKELAEACRKNGIRLGFYYSQIYDWHEPDGAGNDWDFAESERNFSRYVEAKAIPQIRELLEGYGPVATIWFDAPAAPRLTEGQSEEVVSLIRRSQPECLINGRLGRGVGDYRTTGDNQLPGNVLKGDWETPATINDTWGYKVNDHNWKPARVLLQQLVDIASKGGNYLLNVGPTAQGTIPAPSVERLGEIGEWLKINGEAVYGAEPGPFPAELAWGNVTSKPGKLYLHVTNWPASEFQLYGLRNKVTKAYLLADRQRKSLSVTQHHDSRLNHDTLRIRIPSQAPDRMISVIALEIIGKPSVDPTLMQEPGGEIALPAYRADIHHDPKDARLTVDRRGVIEQWINTNEWMSWDFRVVHSGKFRVALLTTEQRNRLQVSWEGGQRMRIVLAGQELRATVKDEGRTLNPRNVLWRDVISQMGQVAISKPGIYTLTLKMEAPGTEQKFGVMLRAVTLTP